MQEDRPQCSVRFQMTVFCLTGKNSRLSQNVKIWTFSRLTTDGNEGVGVEIGYLECTYGKKYYVIDQVNDHINAIHDDNIELTEFTRLHFSPFNLDELEMEVCRLTDHAKRMKRVSHKASQHHNNLFKTQQQTRPRNQTQTLVYKV